MGDFWTPAGITDNDAIHDNVAGEIAAITEKTTPVSGDLILIEDSAASNAKKKVQVGNLPGGGGGSETSPDFINYLAARLARETGNANDDFFDDGSLTGWTTLTVSGTQTITEQDDRLSILPTSAMTASDYNAILKAVTPSTGDYIETRLTLFMPNTTTAGDGIGAGLVWADGNTAGSNLCSFEISRQPNPYSQDYRYLTRTGTFTSFGAAGSIANEQERVAHLYVRLEYDAANTFRCFFSGDGVSWIDLGTQAKTMTPTHVGLIWTTFGGAIVRRSAAFDYFRYN